MKINLLIDGNYFANRSIFTLVKNYPELTLQSEKEQKLFLNQMINDFKNIKERFNIVNKIIFVFDDNSWRKFVTPVTNHYTIRKYIDEINKTNKYGNEEIQLLQEALITGDKKNIENITDLFILYLEFNKINTYKHNRSVTKEESIIDWYKFKQIIIEFHNIIKDYVDSYMISNLEGDDLLFLLKTKYQDKNDYFNIIFCTDGDLKQLLSDNTILFRNITHSKEAPNGEFVVNQTNYDLINKQFTVEEIMFGNSNTPQINLLKSLPNFDGINRKITCIESTYDIILQKIICGDKKDNIESLISWPSSTGTRKYSITSKMIDKVFEKLGISESDKYSMLEEPELPKLFLTHIANETPELDFLRANKHFVELFYNKYLYNKKLNYLSFQNIPEMLVLEFNEQFKNICNKEYQSIDDLFNKHIIKENIFTQSLEEFLNT